MGDTRSSKKRVYLVTWAGGLSCDSGSELCVVYFPIIWAEDQADANGKLGEPLSTLVSSSPAGCHEPSRADPRPVDSSGPREESGQRGQSHPDGQHQQGAAEGGEAGRPDREVRRPAGLRECLPARAAYADVLKSQHVRSGCF